MKRTRREFTLVELLVVIGIMAILAILIIPALNFGTPSSRRIVCMNNLKQIGTSCKMYSSDYKDYFPSALPGIALPAAACTKATATADFQLLVNTRLLLWGNAYVCRSNKQNRFLFWGETYVNKNNDHITSGTVLASTDRPSYIYHGRGQTENTVGAETVLARDWGAKTGAATDESVTANHGATYMNLLFGDGHTEAKVKKSGGIALGGAGADVPVNETTAPASRPAPGNGI